MNAPELCVLIDMANSQKLNVDGEKKGSCHMYLKYNTIILILET